jgi:hypothetical protein
MTENRSATERKQYRERVQVARDKASSETVQYLNQLRDQVTDPEAAEAVAMLHAQVNGGHPDYERPPDREPFGHWHRSLTVDPPTVVSTGTNTATVDVTLSELHLFDTDATVHVRFIEQSDVIDYTTIEAPPQTLAQTGTAQFSTDSLDPDTEYAVQSVAEASVDVQTVTDYSDQTTLVTDPADA